MIQIRLATFISYVFHPILMPILLLFIVFNTDSYIQLATPRTLQLTIYGLVAITTLVLPTFSSLLLVKNGIISSLQMPTKEERRIPFLITCSFYLFTFYLLKQAGISSLIYILFLGASLTLLLTLLINLRWKISAHMVGIGGVIGALIGISMRLSIDYRLLILFLLLLSGTIGSARLLLKAHEPSHIYVGFVVGLVSQLALFLVL